MVSILIPTYNYNIVNLVKQVYKQSVDSSIIFEVIVVDDCSTDIEIKQENKQINQLEFCKLVENSQNLGRTATRNLLASEANYNWLLFLDADVLPKYDDFMNRFQFSEIKSLQIIYGGVDYYKEKPGKDKILRWKYGLEREAKSVSQRLKEPHFIISQNLLIDKTIFLDLNSVETNTYGLDILFSSNIKKKNIRVQQIDNPVYHLGLESNAIFIKKSLEAVKTTYNLEEKGIIENDLRPLQKSYLKLKKASMLSLFNFIISKMKKKMEQSFYSSNPNLFWFDLYRLNYYIELKSKKNA